MTDSTFKEDILAALRKERTLLNTIPMGTMTQEDEDRLSNVVEFIKLINQSGPGREALLEVRVHWTGPLRL